MYTEELNSLLEEVFHQCEDSEEEDGENEKELLKKIELHNPMIRKALKAYGMSDSVIKQIMKSMLTAALRDDGGAPTDPPPIEAPVKEQAIAYAIDPDGIQPCVYRYTYIWLKHGESFWAWLTFVGKKSISGYKWNGKVWVYFGIDLRRIESFICF